MTEAFPLRWPQGWPRTPDQKRDSGSRFGRMESVNGNSWKSRVRITPYVAYEGLIEELRRLGAKNAIISSNVPVRVNGQMMASAADRRLSDPGVAVYFLLKGRPTVMAQDAFIGVAENMRSLTLAIDAMRSLERHGGGTMMQRAFDGFSALPPPEGSKPKHPWWDILRYSANAEDREFLSSAEVEARYRALAKKAHPDAGGSDDAMSELNLAREEALKDLGDAS